MGKPISNKIKFCSSNCANLKNFYFLLGKLCCASSPIAPSQKFWSTASPRIQRGVNRAINQRVCKSTLISAAETVVSAAETIVSAAETTVSAAETAVSAAERWFTDPLIYSPVYVPLKWLKRWTPQAPSVVTRTGLAHKIFFILSLNLLLSSMNNVELSQSKKELFGVHLLYFKGF